MVYQGGKFRQSKQIAPIINLCIKENNIENYYEPFCGGLNVLDKIKCENLFANDIDSDLIAFYQLITSGGMPVEDITKEDYYRIKESGTPAERGMVKYMGSFGGKPWGGYGFRRDSNKSHYAASLTNFKKEIPIIRITNFSCKNYKNLIFKEKSFIYLDPPYKGTTGYEKTFNHEEFYKWTRELSKEHYVIISEYNMPDEFICFKQINYKQCLNADANNRKTVSDNLYYCDGLFKDWIEDRGGIN